MRILSVCEGVEAILDGEIIAYPTEGVFGLGCNAFRLDLVEEIATLKHRSLDKGMIVLISDISIISDWIQPLTGNEVAKLSQRHEDYPYTWLLPKSLDCPYQISGKSGHIATRLTGHYVAKKLCELAKMPLLSTSANPQSLPAAKSCEEVDHYFGSKIYGIVDGAIGSLNNATRIQNIKTDQIIRP